MIQLITAKNEEINIDMREVLRYSGCAAASPDGRLSAMLERSAAEIKTALSCKACFVQAPVSLSEGGLHIGGLSVNSEALKRNLSGCNEAIIFAATVGFRVDRIIQKYSLISPASSLCTGVRRGGNRGVLRPCLRTLRRTASPPASATSLQPRLRRFSVRSSKGYFRNFGLPAKNRRFVK